MSEFRVLFVDDEEELVSTLVERLQYRDIEAVYELTGASAIERMRRESFDVVVVDLKLPGISGSETMRVINKEHPGIPVMIITGHGSSAEMQDMPIVKRLEINFSYVDRYGDVLIKEIS